MIDLYHKHYIQQTARRQKRSGRQPRLRPMLGRCGAACLAGLLMTGCDPVQVIEGSDTHVSIRYDGMMNGLDKATELANRSCAQHGKSARLRKTYYEGLGAGERFAFFDCV